MMSTMHVLVKTNISMGDYNPEADVEVLAVSRDPEPLKEMALKQALGIILDECEDRRPYGDECEELCRQVPLDELDCGPYRVYILNHGRWVELRTWDDDETTCWWEVQTAQEVQGAGQ